MLKSYEIEELVEALASMDQEELIHQFRTYPSTFPVDFTDDFLRAQGVDKLRHVFYALVMHCGRMPDLPMAA